MALETNTLVNGTWTTQTLDVNTVLRHYDQQDKEATSKAVEVEKAPLLGLLTQTVIRSPLVHSILPVRLRSSLLNDVAFIGDNFVQIKELRSDGHLWDVIRKDNFGARIRNATVVGSLKAYDREFNSHNGDILGTQIKDEDDDVDMDVGEHSNGPQSKGNILLPPQVILLQLDTGDTVFLMLRQSNNGRWEFVSSRHRASKSMIKLEAGTHLAVDPSSRYMAVGCSEGLFAIYSLYPRDDLKIQYSESASLRYVQAERHIYVQGIIHKMEFLYPAANDDKHVILLIILVYRGKTRMLVYEWQTGEDLQSIRAHSRKGHLLEECRQLPLLVIPLTIESSFIIVSETSMAICNDILAGSPNIVDFNTIVDDPTSFHHGCGPPLWVAWTRPLRREEHAALHDDIYIVREDGNVKNVEIHSKDDLMHNNIGTIQANCGTALASLDYNGYDRMMGDLLITGGESCGGGAYLIKARGVPEFQQDIQNWSPTHDIVTTSTSQDRDSDEVAVQHRGKRTFPKPDKIYACVGKGLKGEIVEFRHGLEGHIGLETEFHTPIMDVWVLPSESDLYGIDGGSDFLLSLGDRSALLQLSNDAGAIHEIDQTATPFDLRYRTLAASNYGICRVQVTEKSIVFIAGSEAQVQEGDPLLGVYDRETLLGCGEEIAAAVISEGVVLFTIIFEKETFLQVQNLTVSTVPASEAAPKPPGNSQTLAKYSTRITSIAMCWVKKLHCAIAAQWTGYSTILTIQPLDGGNPHSIKVPEVLGDDNHSLEEIISIAASSTHSGHLLLLCGTRNGIVIMLQISEDNLEILDCICDRVGATPAVVRKDDHLSSEELFFVNSDSTLFSFTITTLSKLDLDSPGRRRGRTINQVWLTDVMNPGRPQAKINSVARLPINTSTGIDNGILLVDGSQILVAGLSTQSKAVPRHIPIGGTPSRLLYSQSLDVIIVGAVVDGKSTLIFVDPETGTDLSKPFDRTKNIETESVGGLGNNNERIFRLFEWSYVKDGKTWYFIIVCTSTGRFLMISTEKEGQTQRSHIGQEVNNPGHSQGYSITRPKIRYWTRYKWKCESPIYSAVGSNDGIFYCSGKTLFYETLDLAEKKFKPLAQYELPSPALNLIYEKGILYALTSVHSLEILELVDLGPHGGHLSKFLRTHGDQVTRSSLHNRVIGLSSDHPLHLVSDKECSVVGLWATHNTKADTLEEIFQAELPYSILRFRYGKCRPVWDPVWWSDKYRTTSSKVARYSTNYPETMGLSIDGSLCHFTVLGFAAWNFLRFIVNLALQSPEVCEFTYEEFDSSRLQPVTVPKTMMHVDGDILRRCLEDRWLEKLLGIKSAEGARGENKVQATFCELLNTLHQGNIGNDSAMSTLVERAYEDLEFFLRPVL